MSAAGSLVAELKALGCVHIDVDMDGFEKVTRLKVSLTPDVPAAAITPDEFEQTHGPRPEEAGKEQQDWDKQRMSAMYYASS